MKASLSVHLKTQIKWTNFFKIQCKVMSLHKRQPEQSYNYWKKLNPQFKNIFLKQAHEVLQESFSKHLKNKSKHTQNIA